jgi:hypothetical protein
MMTLTYLDSGEQKPGLQEQEAKLLAAQLSNWNIRVSLTDEETGEVEVMQTYKEAAEKWNK